MQNLNIPSNKERNVIKNKRIVIADADTQSRNLLSLVLRKLGASVEEYNNGKDTYEILQDNTYRKKEDISLLLMGIQMPQMNGINLLRLIRDHTLISELPVYVLYNANEDRELHECSCLGISGNIAKPINVVEAVNSISNTLYKLELKKKQDEPEDKPADTIKLKGEYTELGFPIEFQNIPSRENYPLTTSFYRCPFCEQTLSAPRLKDNSLIPDESDQLLIGLYTTGKTDYEQVNPILIEIISCPNCLWTADREGFMRIWNRDNARINDIIKIPKIRWQFPVFTLTPKLKSDFNLFLRKRMEYMHKVNNLGEGLFTISKVDRKFPRSFQDCLISIDLAIYCNEFILSNSEGKTHSIIAYKAARYQMQKQYIINMLLERTRDKKIKKELLTSRIATIIKAMDLLLTVNNPDLPSINDRCNFYRQKYFLAHMLTNILKNTEQKIRIIKHKDESLHSLNEMLADAVASKNNIEANIINQQLNPIVTHLNLTKINFPD